VRELEQDEDRVLGTQGCWERVRIARRSLVEGGRGGSCGIKGRARSSEEIALL